MQVHGGQCVTAHDDNKTAQELCIRKCGARLVCLATKLHPSHQLQLKDIRTNVPEMNASRVQDLFERYHWWEGQKQDGKSKSHKDGGEKGAESQAALLRGK